MTKTPPPLPRELVKAGPGLAAQNRKFLYLLTVACFLITGGILWDISWHQSIGRDRFLTPPHIVVYLGAILGALSSGTHVMINSFSAKAQKDAYVKLWGIFYSSFGALFCIWGAIAMLTSAPFDNWWHTAFGLDLQILSPPHSLLLAGIFSMQTGTCLWIIKYINLTSPNNRSIRPLQFLLVVTAATFLCMVYTLAISYVRVSSMRDARFYQSVTVITLLLLPGFGKALRLKWGMTAIACCYFLISASSNWILQIFPAEPKLGPILTHTTHFQPGNFPLLIMVPAYFMDLLLQKFKGNDWIRAACLSMIFVLTLVTIQYPFSGFLRESPSSRNWFFGGDAWYYQNPPDAPFRYKFSPTEIQPLPFFAVGILIAIVLGMLVSLLSLTWGKWMLHIRR